MDLDFDAQLGKARGSEFIQLYKNLISSYTNVNGTWYIMEPRVRFYRWRLSRRIDQLLKAMIKQKFAEHKRLAPTKKSRSVLSLSLQDNEAIDAALLTQTSDQLKTFLFAGHDTTSILLQWIFFELARTPRALAAVRAELDDIFGTDPDPAIVREKLLAQGEEATRRMSYTSAVIKETLRLYPPAGTARMSRPGSNMVVRLPESGAEVCLDGLVLYNCASIIQRDPAVYGETAEDFVPERWLGDVDTSMDTNNDVTPDEKSGQSKVPPSAWRPFERGPRNCIGQELANLEARVILACAVRRYDFTKIGLGENALDKNGNPVLNSKDQYEVKADMYSVSITPSHPAPLGKMLARNQIHVLICAARRAR